MPVDGPTATSIVPLKVSSHNYVFVYPEKIGANIRHPTMP